MTTRPLPSGNVTDGGISAEHTKVFLPVFVAPSSKKTLNTVTKKLKPVACWRLDDLRFAFDSSVVTPDSKVEFTALAALWKSTSRAPLSVFGHADPVGDDVYNKQLSGRRARAVYAVLTRKVDIWEDLFSHAQGGDSWGLRSLQMMLTALGHYQGPLDGIDSHATQNAVKSFQDADNSRDTSREVDNDDGDKDADPSVPPPPPPDPGAPLTVDGEIGPKTRAALFRAYMTFLCRKPDDTAFVLKQERFLGAAKDPDLKGDVQGCSEFNPVLVFSTAEDTDFKKPSRKAARDADNSQNRRVVVFLFPPGSALSEGEWPCPSSKDGVAACKSQFWPDADVRRNPQEKRRKYAQSGDTMACRFYDEMARRSPCETTRQTLSLFLLDDAHQRMRNARYRISVGTQVRVGQSDADGHITEKNVFVPSRAILVWGLRDSSLFDKGKEVGAENVHQLLSHPDPDDDASYDYRVEMFLDIDDQATKELDREAARRLHNLGYPQDNTLADNVTLFQSDYGLPNAPWFDPVTKDKLFEVHRDGIETDPPPEETVEAFDPQTEESKPAGPGFDNEGNPDDADS